MRQSIHADMSVDAEVNLPIATARLARFNMAAPIDRTMQVQNSYWLDFCLTPRPLNARARYRDHWGPDRFKPLGNVFILPAGEALHTRSDGCSSQSSLLCLINPEKMQQWFDGELSWTDQRLEASLDITEASVRGLLLRLAEELRHPGFASEALVELLIGQLAIELSRYCINVNERPRAGGLAAWRLRLIDERLREVREAPTLAELADLCGLSVRQLTRGFRASRECSIGDYVANNRIDQARQMLATDISIKAIAYTLGFSSPSSFCYAFRRAAGETPGIYRQRLHRSGH
ncbi:helix-turn-helix transcriptional regulator [Halioxenophilus sp. WMMB6]|uniref:helix-turn-helix transcriptional regulator n=1 Tax=Halioxenophilus sp. WMMB6 TaxID=3073815 RepID=UPI00295E4609|nr:helix-turn-helix transcriptional regulator [Halioxenophilus sp. WMMB6]